MLTLTHALARPSRVGRTFDALFLKNDVEMWLQKFHELDTGGTGKIPVSACLAIAGASLLLEFLLPSLSGPVVLVFHWFPDLFITGTLGLCV